MHAFHNLANKSVELSVIIWLCGVRTLAPKVYSIDCYWSATIKVTYRWKYKQKLRHFVEVLKLRNICSWVWTVRQEKTRQGKMRQEKARWGKTREVELRWFEGRLKKSKPSYAEENKIMGSRVTIKSKRNEVKSRLSSAKTIHSESTKPN